MCARQRGGDTHAHTHTQQPTNALLCVARTPRRHTISEERGLGTRTGHNHYFVGNGARATNDAIMRHTQTHRTGRDPVPKMGSVWVVGKCVHPYITHTHSSKGTPYRLCGAEGRAAREMMTHTHTSTCGPRDLAMPTNGKKTTACRMALHIMLHTFMYVYMERRLLHNAHSVISSTPHTHTPRRRFY